MVETLRALRLAEIQVMATCSHVSLKGGKDYLLCNNCGLDWDYRSESPERALIRLLLAAISSLQAENTELKTLAKVGAWHDGCRPNREMAARELLKSQAVIDRLADRIALFQQSFAFCAMHTPELWEGDGTCVICEGIITSEAAALWRNQLAEATVQLRAAEAARDEAQRALVAQPATGAAGGSNTPSGTAPA